MESSNKSVFLFADLAPAHQEAIQKGVGYDGTSYTLKDGTKITIVAEGYEVVSPVAEVVAPGIVDVGDGIAPAPENDLAKDAGVVSNMPATNTPEVTSNTAEAGSPTTQEVSAPSDANTTEGTQTAPEVTPEVADAAATNEVVPEANTN